MWGAAGADVVDAVREHVCAGAADDRLARAVCGDDLIRAGATVETGTGQRLGQADVVIAIPAR